MLFYHKKLNIITYTCHNNYVNLVKKIISYKFHPLPHNNYFPQPPITQALPIKKIILVIKIN